MRTLAVVLGTLLLAQGSHLFGGLGGLDMLLQNPGVLKELKLSDEQVTRVKEVVHEMRLKHREDWEKIRDLSEEERRDRLPEVIKLVSDDTMKSLHSVLSVPQVRRLKQIQWQNDGLGAFSDDEVIKALQLTVEQKEKIRALNSEVNRQWHDLVTSSAASGTEGNRYREIFRKLSVIRREARDKGVGLLTAAQKKTWKDLVGEPFEVKIEQLRTGKAIGMR
jgi:hypothetical protein